MAKFAIGDVVKKDKGSTGTVRGAVDFVEEAKLSDSPKTDLAA